MSADNPWNTSTVSELFKLLPFKQLLCLAHTCFRVVEIPLSAITMCLYYSLFRHDSCAYFRSMTLGLPFRSIHDCTF